MEAGKLCTQLIVDSAESSKQVFVDAGATVYEVDLQEWQDAMDGFVEQNYPNLLEYYNMILDADPAKYGAIFWGGLGASPPCPPPHRTLPDVQV